MAEVKLLPCPFCGGSALSFESAYADVTLWNTRCQVCYAAHDGHNTRQQSEAAWNTRKPDARLSELKDTLVEALNGMNDLFREAEGQSVFVIRKLGGGITNGDQDGIDAVFTKLDAALSAAALFEQERGTK